MRTFRWSGSNSRSSQLQANCEQWQKASHELPNYEWSAERGITTAQPEGILVIGRLARLGGDREKEESFERFRRHLWNPRVLTYDELYARAEFIVARTAQQPSEAAPEPPEPDFIDWGTEDNPF